MLKVKEVRSNQYLKSALTYSFIAPSKDEEGVSAAGLVDMLGWDSEESPVETFETKRKNIHFSMRRRFVEKPGC